MKKSKKSNPRVVIDTNLLISAAIVSKGFPNNLIRIWQSDRISLIISTRLLHELEEVSKRDKFAGYHLFKEQMIELVDNIKAAGEIILSMSDEQLPIRSRDPKDDKFLACAISADADYLITGDEDLLVLKDNPALGKLRIITVKDFIFLLQVANKQ